MTCIPVDIDYKSLEENRLTLSFADWIRKNASIILPVLIIILLLSLSTLSLSKDRPLLYTFLFVVLCLNSLTLAVIGIFLRLYPKHSERQSSVISKFAQANHFGFDARPSIDTYQGIVFNTGTHRRVFDRVRGDGFEIGDFEFRIPFSDTEVVYNYGYAALTLRRDVSNILLDSLTNNKPASFIDTTKRKLVMKPPRHTILHLEGNFDKYFTTYVPDGYAPGALYILAPDIMELFINEARLFDIEFIDNTIYLFSPSPFKYSEDFKAVFNVLSKLSAKINR